MTPSVLNRDGTRPKATASVDAGTPSPATFKSVLVGVDGTSSGRDAIALAENLCDADGRLAIAYVVQPPFYWKFPATGAGKQARGMLENEREATGVSAELTGIFAPSVGRGLHQLAADTGADLLVVGSCSRRPVARLLGGDDTRGTLTGATCPVAVAPPGYAERSKPLDTIGVAYDGSRESEIALMGARVLAARHGSVLRAQTAVWPTRDLPGIIILRWTGPHGTNARGLVREPPGDRGVTEDRATVPTPDVE